MNSPLGCPYGVDVLQEIAAGNFPAFGTDLEGLEIVAVSPMQATTSGASGWKPVKPGSVSMMSLKRDPENIFARAANAFTIRITGDRYAPARESSLYKTVKAVANSLEIAEGDDVVFVFAFSSKDAIITLGKVVWDGALKGAELGTEFCISGVLRDKSYMSRLVELDGTIRKLQPEDELVTLLLDVKVWSYIYASAH